MKKIIGIVVLLGMATFAQANVVYWGGQTSFVTGDGVSWEADNFYDATLGAVSTNLPGATDHVIIESSLIGEPVVTFPTVTTNVGTVSILAPAWGLNGTLNVTTNGVITAGLARVGHAAGVTGTINIDGNGVVVATGLEVGYNAVAAGATGGSGIINLSENAILHVDSVLFGQESPDYLSGPGYDGTGIIYMEDNSQFLYNGDHTAPGGWAESAVGSNGLLVAANSGSVVYTYDTNTLRTVFTAEPLKVALEVLPGATSLALHWSSSEMFKYTVQSRDDLTLSSWTNTAAVDLIGTGGGMAVTTTVDQVLSFYRVVGNGFVLNWGFELGNLDTWIKTGDAFDNDPASTNWPSWGYEGTYLVNTFFSPNGEDGQGTLKSQSFVLGDDEILQLRMGGWSGTSPGLEDYNYVTLNRISDGLELDRVYAPGVTGFMATRQMAHGLVGDVEVYVEVVDDSGVSFAWFSVDDFLVAQANPTFEENNGFELGTLGGWTPNDGNAFWSQPALKTWPNLDVPAPAPWPSGGVSGDYLINTFHGQFGAAATGALTSATFTLEADERLGFYIGGWSSPVGAGPETFSYVTLNRASDDAELDRVWAPNITGIMAERNLTHNTNVAVDVYVQIVDNSANGWAWLSVDEFKPFVYVPFIPDASFGSHTNGGFELGDWTGWTVDGLAFGSAPFDNAQGVAIAGWTGTYYGLSRAGGEPATGTLTSETITFGTTDTISFLIGGYSGTTPGAEDWNYVALKRAFDDSEIDRVWAPFTTSTMEEASFVSTTNIAENVYIEVVDDSTGTSFAWLTVDDFQIH